MLAYVFWHRPSDPGAVEDYERALIAFHRSLERTPPAGMRASACFRSRELPWAGDGPAMSNATSTMPAPAAVEPAYEDWYLLDDHAALGVLGEAATGLGHRTTHDDIAARSGAGAGGLYALLEGEPDARALAGASLAVWINPPQQAASRRRAAAESGLAEMLGDGMDRSRSSLWRRQLVLGPAAEFCTLGPEVPRGVSPARLPRGWRARTVERELVWAG